MSGEDSNGNMNRAEQASYIQDELRAIAANRGWEAPDEIDMPFADSASGLPDGTPLASKLSITPGQDRRLENLLEREHRTQADNKMLLGLRGNDSVDETRLMAAVSRQVRESMASSQYIYRDLPNGDKMPITIRADEALNREKGGTTIPWRADSEMRTLQQAIHTRLAEAAQLYDRKPDEYAKLTDTEFLDLLEEYTKDILPAHKLYLELEQLDELATNKVSLGYEKIRQVPSVNKLFSDAETNLTIAIQAIRTAQDARYDQMIAEIDNKYGAYAKDAQE